jgi:hypothetical protein
MNYRPQENKELSLFIIMSQQFGLIPGTQLMLQKKKLLNEWVSEFLYQEIPQDNKDYITF